MNQDVLINFCLDRSGSMWGLVDATVDGFNEYMETIRQAPGEARLSLTFFDTSFDARFVAAPLASVAKLGDKDNPYSPSGGTALLDAVGTTIKGTEQWLIAHPEFAGRVVCVVLTDGYENSSQIWHLNQPPKDGDDKDLGLLIKHKREVDGWEFVFMGAGGSEWLEKAFGAYAGADAFVGYSNDRATNRRVYAASAKSLNMSRSTGTAYTGASVADSLATDGKGQWESSTTSAP